MLPQTLSLVFSLYWRSIQISAAQNISFSLHCFQCLPVTPELPAVFAPVLPFQPLRTATISGRHPHSLPCEYCRCTPWLGSASLPRVSSPSILSFTVLCAAAPTSLPATISATMLDLDPAVIHGIYTVVGELEAQSQPSTNVIEGTIRQFQCIVVIPGDVPMCCNGTIHAVLIPISTCCEFGSRTGQ